MKPLIYFSLMILLSSQGQAGSLEVSGNAFDLMLNSCSKQNFHEKHKEFKRALQTDVMKANESELSSLMYKDTKEALLFSFFGIYLFKEEPSRSMPLKVCWVKLFESEREEDLKLKREKLREWSHCTDSIYQEEIPLIKKYESCVLKSLSVKK